MRSVLRLASVAPMLTMLAWAQSDRATIIGTVADPTGAVVPATKVTAIDVSRNTESSTETTSRGDYTIPGLTVGTYRVQIVHPGFKTFVRTNVVLTAGITVRVDAALEIGAVSESVSITAEAQPLATDSSKIMTAINNRFIDELPLVVAGTLRSPFQLAQVAPEARATGNFSIGGGQDGGWNASLDGIDATPAMPYFQQLWTAINSPSVDAITEFSMDTNGYKAEFGRASGGSINFVSKSGGNDFHGSAYEFLRNDHLDSNTWFNNALSLRRPILKQSDFGFTAGGPLYIPKLYNGKNKTFFFLSYEGFRNRSGTASTYMTIPLPEMYQGNFSNWKDAKGVLMPIYDPSNTRQDASGKWIRDPFSGNQIPQARFSELSKKVIALATMTPNTPDPSGILNPNPRNNYVTVASGSLQPWDKLDVKADHNFSPRDRLGFLFHWAQTLVNPLGAQPPGLPVPLTGFEVDNSHVNVFRWTWDHVLSPRMLNHISVGYNYWFQLRKSYNAPGSSGGGWGTKLGIKNVPDPDLTFPTITMDGYTTWGNSSSQWSGSDAVTGAIADDLSFTTGSHSLKFGFNFQTDHYNGYAEFNGTGGFTFSRQTTSVPQDQTNTSGNGFASMLLGLVNSGTITELRYVSDQYHYWAGYAQDDWRITKRLTLNYGLRYEYTPPTVEGHFPDGYSNFDPTLPNPGAGGRLGAMIFAGTGPGRTGKRTMYDPWPWGFGPRLGLAYSLNDKTVIRASAARSFAAVKNSGGSAHWQGFYTEYTWTSQDQSLTQPFNWDNGAPAWPKGPYLRPDYLNLNGVTTNSIPYWPNPDSGRLPEYLSWTFNIQRQLPSNLVAEVGYNATMGHHLSTNLVALDQMNPTIFYSYVNQLGFDAAYSLMNQQIGSAAATAAGVPYPYSGFSGTVGQALRPYPQYGGIDTSSSSTGDRSGNSSYNALILKLDKRYSNGLQLLASYVFSKMFSTGELATGRSAAAMNTYNTKLERALCSSDQTHVFKLNYSYELPFGKGRKWANQGIAGYLVGGWRLAGVQTYNSGQPTSISPGYSLRIPGAGNRISVTDYEGWVATPKNGNFDPYVDLWWNTSVMNRTPATSAPSGAKVWVSKTQFGNATQRDPKVRSPWALNENISLARSFKLTERIRLDFRWEAFNLLNRVMWGSPDSTITSTTFGLVRSTANTPRQMQGGLKLYW